MAADFASEIDNLRTQRLTPGRFFLAVCDGKLTDSDLSVEGNAFAQVYFEDGDFLADYEGSAGQGLPSLYHVADSWGDLRQAATTLRQASFGMESGAILGIQLNTAAGLRNLRSGGSRKSPSDIRATNGTRFANERA